jgi:hypothetical protein
MEDIEKELNDFFNINNKTQRKKLYDKLYRQAEKYYRSYK